MMSNVWVIASFIILLVIALLIAFYPLRKNKLANMLLAPVFIIAVSAAYWSWGGWVDWQYYLVQQVKQKQVQVLLKSVNGPQELIDKLKIQLDSKPSARGWYLLGRLFASKDEWLQARDTFAKAYHLQPKDEQIIVNYAQSLWQTNHRQFNKESREMFYSVLNKNSQQPDALAMLAMDAFLTHDYQLAIEYWQRLLKLTPSNSADAQAIRKAIAKAQQNIKT